MYVYVIRNSATGKIYIGRHKGNDLKKYLQVKFSQAFYELKRKGHGRGSHLFASMRKHPKEVWSIAPLFEGIETKAELDRLETLLIALYDTRNPDVGYNICKGGEGFTGEFTEEHKRKMRENASRYWKGKSRSPESITKMVATRTKDGTYINPNLQTPESVAKRVASRRSGSGYMQHVGRKNTFETIEKMRLSAIARSAKKQEEVRTLCKSGLSHADVAEQLKMSLTFVKKHARAAFKE